MTVHKEKLLSVLSQEEFMALFLWNFFVVSSSLLALRSSAKLFLPNTKNFVSSIDISTSCSRDYNLIKSFNQARGAMRITQSIKFHDQTSLLDFQLQVSLQKLSIPPDAASPSSAKLLKIVNCSKRISTLFFINEFYFYQHPRSQLCVKNRETLEVAERYFFT